MSVFSIDTTTVSSVADSINGLSSKASSISSNVSSYDTSNTDGFSFDAAKAAIENNIKGMETKISNTAKLLETVAGTHESIQSSVNGADANTSSTSSNIAYSGGRGTGGSGSSSGASATPTVPTEFDTELINQVSPNVDQYGTTDVTGTSPVSTLIPDLTNLSARDALLSELGATVGLAVSNLAASLDVVLSTNNIQVVEPDDLMVISNNKSIIVVEARSDDVKLSQYLQRLTKVAEEFKLEVKLLKLDNIISPSLSTNLVTTTTTEEDVEKNTETPTEENKEETKDTITDDKDEQEKKDFKILDQTEYNKLVNLRPIGQNDVVNNPITMVIKDNMIRTSMNGYLTELTIRTMLNLTNL